MLVIKDLEILDKENVNLIIILLIDFYILVSN
jgi:hypothetical protein